MKWSIKIGRIAGIDVFLHATFLILVAWLAASEYFASRSAAAMLSAIGFVLLLFVIIVLHELGHALAARKYGIETEDITLLPIGGVARLRAIPEDPREELVVAIAGPLVNLVIAAGLFIGIVISSGISHVTHAGLDGGDFTARLLWVNVWLAFFNMLPAFPMDGGRVLRALLALKMSRERATEIAVGVGHVMALLFGAVGLLTNISPFLVFIALFIWIGADGELQQVRMRSSLRGIRVAEVMATRFDTVTAETTLGEVARLLVPGFQNDYPVLDKGRLIGFLGVDNVLQGLRHAGADGRAVEFSDPDFEVASADDDLERIVAGWQPKRDSVVAVMEGDRLIGIVTPANVGEHVMVRSALMQAPPQSAPRPFAT